MGRSKNPTAWPEPRRDKRGRIISWRAQWEMGLQRGKPVATGPSKAYCKTICQQLITLMWAKTLTPDDDPRPILFPSSVGRRWGDLVPEYRKSSPNKAASTWRNFEGPAADDFGVFIKNRTVASIVPKDCLDYQAWLRGDVVVARERGIPARVALSKEQRAALRAADKDMPLTILGETTIAMRGRAIKALFYFAKDVLRWITENPATAIEWPAYSPKGQLLPDDELAKLRPYAEQKIRHGKSVWDILMVALYLGMRNGVICGLDGRQVDKVHRALRLTKLSRVRARGRAALKTENKKERVVSIPDAIWYIFADAPAEGRIFAGWNVTDVGRKLCQACAEAGIPNIKHHWGKHTFITRAVEAGLSLKTVAAITGNTLQSLQFYVHVEDRVPQAAVERIKYELGAKSSHHPTHQKEKPPSP